MTGIEKPNVGPATCKIPESDAHEDRPTIWLWSHGVKDGDGHVAEHFDLLSQECHKVKTMEKS